MSKEKTQPASANPPAAPAQAQPQPQQQAQRFHLKYESMTAMFADHVVLNGINGGLVLDFASSIVNDPNTGDATIPVHTRIAMTHQGAAQLLRMLTGVFAQGTGEAGQ